MTMGLAVEADRLAGEPGASGEAVVMGVPARAEAGGWQAVQEIFEVESQCLDE